MKKIYSKVEEDVLLLVINKKEDITKERTDLSPESQFLQCSTKVIKKGVRFRSHKHKRLERKTDRTQEAWLVLSGKIRCLFYDLDDSLILDTNLTSGDCAICFRAGNGFEVLEDDTSLYEFKTGPYFGSEMDKTFIHYDPEFGLT